MLLLERRRHYHAPDYFEFHLFQIFRQLRSADAEYFLLMLPRSLLAEIAPMPFRCLREC